MTSKESRHAFALTELAVVTTIAITLTIILIPTLNHTRNAGMNQVSIANLAAIGELGAQYANDNNAAIYTFSWKAGIAYPDLKSGSTRTYNSDQEAASAQAQNILQRATGRITGPTAILHPNQRLVHRRYSHLPLADYMGVKSIMSDMWVDPADSNLLDWRNNPLGYLEQNSNFPYANGIPLEAGYDDISSWTSTSIVQLWAFASSYQVVPAAWSQDSAPTYIPVGDTPHLFQSIGGTQVPLGGRTFFEVRAPAHKVHLFEEFDREQPGSPYFAYDHAQPAKLMFDGAVNTLPSGLARSSTSPADPHTPWTQHYLPLDTFPIPLDGLGSPTQLDMRYRWTRGGLQGIDYTALLSPYRPNRAKHP